MFAYFNPNPCRAEEPDCVVRALAAASGLTWDEVFTELCDDAYRHCTMPSVNWLWGAWLEGRGFTKHLCGDCLTVGEFARRHRKGTFVCCTGSHAVCVRDGDWMDIWDSGGERIAYYYGKEE